MSKKKVKKSISEINIIDPGKPKKINKFINPERKSLGVKKLRPLSSVISLELNYFSKSFKRSLSLNKEFKNQAINIFLAITSNINYPLKDIHKLSVLRLYLLQTKRGYFHALGKPVRGQRT